MVKVKNIGNAYFSAGLEVAAGEVVEVSEERAAYLVSDECPGRFERVQDEKKKGGK